MHKGIEIKNLNDIITIPKWHYLGLQNKYVKNASFRMLV